jgi:transaldolase
MNEDQMATEKLSDGIRGFVVDQNKLGKALAELL